jgi:hypothetical protein
VLNFSQFGPGVQELRETFNFSLDFHSPPYLLQINRFLCSFSRQDSFLRPLPPSQVSRFFNHSLGLHTLCAQLGLFQPTVKKTCFFLANHSSYRSETWHPPSWHYHHLSSRFSFDSVQRFPCYHHPPNLTELSTQNKNRLLLLNHWTDRSQTLVARSCHCLLRRVQFSDRSTQPLQRCTTPFPTPRAEISDKTSRFINDPLLVSPRLFAC